MKLVKVNVYDLLDISVLKICGLGLHHSGVQIGVSEYEFGACTGINIIEPLQAQNAKFSHTIKYKSIDEERVTLILRELYTEFTEDNYDMLSRNCNHFTEAFVYKLTKQRIPKYINRISSLFAHRKSLKSNIKFINYLNKQVKWFPITDTMQYIMKNGKLGDDILQIGVLHSYYDKIKTINDKRYIFEETIYGFRVLSRKSLLVANIWLFGDKNEFMTVYSGPNILGYNTYLLHKILKNEWLRTQYLTRIFKYDYGDVKIPIIANSMDYIQILNQKPKYNDFLRMFLNGNIKIELLL